MTLRTSLLAAAVAAVTFAPQVRGTATMTGAVVDAGGAGLAGVEVRAVDDLSTSLLTRRTDADGRFAFTAMPEGRYVLTAVAGGFLSTRYGAMAPGEPGVPIRLRSGGSVTDLIIVLEREAAIAGRIATADGDPVPSAVHAIAVSWVDGRQSLRQIATARTDADGRYDVSGLPPGDYLVLAAPFDMTLPRGEAAGDSETAYQMTFYPGVAASAYAATLTLGTAERASGIDIVVRRVPVTSVRATLARAGRDPVAYVSVLLLLQDAGEAGLLVDTSPALRALGFPRVPAGRHVAIGTALAPSASGALERLWAVAYVDVDGRTPVETALDLMPGAVVEGRVVGGGSVPGGDVPETWLWPVDRDRPDGILPFGGTLAQQPSGAFAITGIAPGRYVMQFGRDAASQASGWSIRRIMLQGQDYADLPLDLRAGDRIPDVEVMLSNRMSELQGLLTDANGSPRFDVTLVAFPADTRYWWTGTRRIQMARPDTSGFYLMRGLPEGEYLLAAVTGPLPAEPSDPGYLSQLTGAAVPVIVTDGGRTVQDLRTPGISR
jgi:5-hydroxyisourate hydrolase-like protein (transthyretin family)